jgi:hypothetical protein
MTFGEKLLSVSGLPSGSTLGEHLASIIPATYTAVVGEYVKVPTILQVRKDILVVENSVTLEVKSRIIAININPTQSDIVTVQNGIRIKVL